MLIHKMRLDDYKAVLDVNSGAVHLVDDLIYDLLDVFNGENGEEAINAMKDRYDEAELREAVEELTELKMKDCFSLLNLKYRLLSAKHRF